MGEQGAGELPSLGRFSNNDSRFECIVHRALCVAGINAECLGDTVVGVIFPLLRKQRLSELTLTGAHLVSPSGAEAGE